jgi:GntR family transcriptional regulator
MSSGSARRRIVERESDRGSSPANAKRSARYRHIADQLAADISAGRYTIGSLLPSEAEFCDRFVASRHTVREALRILTANGLIIRRAGAGSTVVSTSQQMVLVPSVGTVEPVLNVPTAVVRKNIDARFIEADDRLAQHLQCPHGTPWFKISEVRYSGVSAAAYPVGALDIFVLPQYATVRSHKSYMTVPVHLQIERIFGCFLDHAEVSIVAARVPADLAPLLKVEPNSAALRVVRRYFDAKGQMYEISSSIYPEGRYNYTLNFRKEERR